MKKIYSLFILFAFFINANASTFSLQNNGYLSGSVMMTDTKEFNISINNTTGSTISLSWQKANSTTVIPSGWTITLCDNAACNSVIPTGINNMTAIPSGGSGFFKLTVSPTTLDSIIIKLNVWNSSDGVIDSAIFHISSVPFNTGIPENSLSGGNFSVYPNPAKDFIGLKFKSENTKVKSLAVFDILGNSVMNIEDNGKSDLSRVNINNLAPGVYILKIMDKDGIASSRRFYKSN